MAIPRPRCGKRMTIVGASDAAALLRGRAKRRGTGSSTFTLIPVPKTSLLSEAGTCLAIGKTRDPGGVSSGGFSLVVHMGSGDRRPGGTFNVFGFRAGGGRHEFGVTSVNFKDTSTAAGFAAISCRTGGFKASSCLIALRSLPTKRCKIITGNFSDVTAFSIG